MPKAEKIGEINSLNERCRNEVCFIASWIGIHAVYMMAKQNAFYIYTAKPDPNNKTLVSLDEIASQI